MMIANNKIIDNNTQIDEKYSAITCLNSQDYNNKNIPDHTLATAIAAFINGKAGELAEGEDLAAALQPVGI